MLQRVSEISLETSTHGVENPWKNLVPWAWNLVPWAWNLVPWAWNLVPWEAKPWVDVISMVLCHGTYLFPWGQTGAHGKKVAPHGKR